METNLQLKQELAALCHARDWRDGASQVRNLLQYHSCEMATDNIKMDPLGRLMVTWEKHCSCGAKLGTKQNDYLRHLIDFMKKLPPPAPPPSLVVEVVSIKPLTKLLLGDGSPNRLPIAEPVSCWEQAWTWLRNLLK